MTKVEIKLDLDDTRFPLYRKYPMEMFPQPCGFELDLESGVLTTFVSGEVGNAVPEPVWNNRILRFEIEPLLTSAKIQELAEANIEKFQAVLDGSEIVWNGSNYVGKLDDAAVSLHEEWNQLCLGYEESQLITVPELMEYEQEPQTLAELRALVEKMVGYDGIEGLYEREPEANWIEEEILDWLIEERLYAGEKIGPEIAKLIMERDIFVGSIWEEDLQAFAAEADKGETS